MAKFTISVFKHGDDGEVDEILEKEVTAEQVIDMLIADPAVIYQEVEVEVEDEEEKKPKTPVSNIPAENKQRRTKYDKEAMIEDIKADELTPAEIATKYDVTVQTVYSQRHRLNTETGEIDEPLQEPKTPGLTSYGQKAQDRANRPPASTPTIEERVRDMVGQGLSFSEMELAFPAVPFAHLKSLYEKYKI